MIKDTNYYDKLVTQEGREISDYLIEIYNKINNLFKQYGSKKIDPIFSSYLESKGYTPDYFNIRNYDDLLNYTLNKFESFIFNTASPFDDFNIVYNGKKYTLSYAKLYDLLKSGKLNSFFNSNEKIIKLFSKIWELLKKQDVNYQFRKKTGFYKTEI